MKIENLLLLGSCYRKKTPSEYDFNGNKGYTYSILFDTGESGDCYTLKVRDDIYNKMAVGKKYCLVCTVNIDTANARSNQFYVTDVFECESFNDLLAVSSDSIESSVKNNKK